MAVSRRVFLKLAASGTAAAAAGAAGVKEPQRLISYVEPMDHRRPGSVVLYASTCRECPAGCGMHLWQREARVTKAEGNPLHPVNTGRLCPRGQASLQGLYDPDRLTTPLRITGGSVGPIAWDQAMQGIGQKLALAKGVLVISDLETGLLGDLLNQFARKWGGQAIFYEPVDYQYLVRGHAAAGVPAVVPHYHLDQSRYILSFGADFLETWISPVEFSRAFIHNRDLHNGEMGRFTYIGPRQSMTAGNADEIHRVAPSRLAAAAWAILGQVLQTNGDTAGIGQKAGDRLKSSEQGSPLPHEDVQRIAKAFVQSGSGIALAGSQSGGPVADEVAMAVALLNRAVGAEGKRVDYGQPHALTAAVGNGELAHAFQQLDQNTVVLIHSSNPVYSAPHLAEQLRKAGTIVYLGTMLDETGQVSDWALPTDYPLEAWGEYAPYHGLTGILQPTMGRMYETRMPGDILLDLANAAGKPLDQDKRSFHDRIKSRYDATALQKGFVESTRGPAPTPPTSQPASTQPSPTTAPSSHDTAELWLYPSIMLYDGRLANRGWMQEIGEPIAFATWGSWLDMHPKRALSLGLKQDMVVRLEQSGQWVEVPVRVTEEIDENTVALQLGQGHSHFGRSANGVGVNGWLIQGTAPGLFGSVKIQRTDKIGAPAYISPTEEQYHRDILQWLSLSQVASLKPGQHDELIMPLPEGYKQNRDLYPPHQYKEHRWAMVADLNRCIGCGACTAACYAENNIPIVGKEQVNMSREMAWLRVVPYRNQEDPHKVGWLPLLCQQCDAAPCEPVCPVFASVHNDEGLNAQVYNRCIGTRYCNNNCPYKVRRFNWRDPQFPKPLDMQLNPEVSVRSRGVMEKCTFCIQRIRNGEYQAKLEDRKVRDGDIQTACQETCPTDVFTFGDLMDPNSSVSKLVRSDPRAYQVLKELNTKPAVIYLKRIDASKA